MTDFEKQIVNKNIKTPLKISNYVQMQKISLFIPTYNDVNIIKANVEKVLNYCREHFNDFEIFIVDDNSNDGTDKECLLLKKHPEITYIKYNIGPSRRENLAKSFQYARGGIIAFIDSDLATNLDYLSQLINGIIVNNYDICIGSRYIKNSKTKRFLVRKLVSFFYNNFMKLYFKSNIRDHQCGFKAYKRDVILNLVKHAGYIGEKKRGWFWDVEILLRAQAEKYIIKEIPIEWIESKTSSFGLFEELKIVPYILSFKGKLKKNERIFQK